MRQSTPEVYWGEFKKDFLLSSLTWTSSGGAADEGLVRELEREEGAPGEVQRGH